jgi:hypothetical protein
MRGPETGGQSDIWRAIAGLQGRKPSEINTDGAPAAA